MSYWKHAEYKFESGSEVYDKARSGSEDTLARLSGGGGEVILTDAP
jgi:hypothetical protein